MPQPMFHVLEEVAVVNGRSRFEMLFCNVVLEECLEYVRARPHQKCMVCEILGVLDAEPIAKEPT